MLILKLQDIYLQSQDYVTNKAITINIRKLKQPDQRVICETNKNSPKKETTDRNTSHARKINTIYKVSHICMQEVTYLKVTQL